MINAWKRLALLFLVLLSAGPNVALSDHIYPRNLSANGPWKTNLQHITAGVRGDLQVSDRNRRLAEPGDASCGREVLRPFHGRVPQRLGRDVDRGLH